MYEIKNGLLFKDNIELTKEELTNIVISQNIEINCLRVPNSGLVVHRCMRCGCTSTVEDEIASHPAFGC